MKTPTIEEVIDHFKDAEEVECLFSGEIKVLNHKPPFSDVELNCSNRFNSNFLWMGSTRDLNCAVYQIDTQQYAKITKYKNQKYDLSKLTPEIVQELIKEPNIHEMFLRIGVVKNEIPFGSWVVDDCYPQWMAKYEDGYIYGFNVDGLWFDKYPVSFKPTQSMKIATPEEVTKRLIEYANGIGFIDGVRFNALSDNGDNRHLNCIFESFTYLSKGGFQARTPESTWGTNQSNPYIMKDGIWATIIKEETYIKIPLSEIKSTPNDCDLGKLVRQIAG